MRLSVRLQADPGAKLTRAESALLRRMLRIARTIYEHETDFSIPPNAANLSKLVSNRKLSATSAGSLCLA